MRSDGVTAAATCPSVAPPASSRRSDYAELSSQIRQAGLMKRRPVRYAWRIALTVLLLAGGWVAFVLVGNSWWQVAVAVFFAIVFTQVGFLGHDVGHQQVSRRRRISSVLGLLLGNLGIGLSYEWWVGKHNRHHVHPNTEGADPDIAVGALAFTQSQAASSQGLLRVLFRFQAYLFFPLLLAEAASLHVASVRSLATRSTRERTRWWAAEVALLAANFAGYFAAVFLVLPPVKAIVFILINQGLFGLYLGASFAPNHKGMPILDATDRSDFLRRQVLTSRNVTGGWLSDLALGGLNYQIEHHLFPSMPRSNLRRAQPLIREFCRQREVSYCEVSLIASYAQALRHLNTVGKPPASAKARRVSPAPSGGTAAS
jgi:fatty acid desaturase